jgi:hypothetical protein
MSAALDPNQLIPNKIALLQHLGEAIAQIGFAARDPRRAALDQPLKETKIVKTAVKDPQ